MAVKEAINYEAIFNDLGYDNNELGQLAKEATIKHCRTIEHLLEDKFLLEWTVGEYYDGYYDALKSK